MQQLKLIALYYYICEIYDRELRWHCQRFSPNSTEPEFSDTELLTCYLFSMIEEQKYQIKSIWTYIHKYWGDWFPQLPSYQAFNSRLNRLSGVFPLLLQDLLRNVPPNESIRKDISLVDSFPIMLCSHKRSAKVARALSDKGYCATKNQHYYGLKLHLIGFFQPGGLPFPEYIQFSPASWHDLQALRNILDQLPGRVIVGDKIYADKELRARLRTHNDSDILTPVKLVRGQSEWERTFNRAADGLFSTAVSRMRQSIESIFNWFIEKVDLQNASKVRSVQGLMVHLFGRLSAAFATLVFNP